MEAGGGKLLAALNEAGAVDALVATLTRKSPFCVAAAAGALASVARAKGGPAAIEASGAVPALVRVVNRRIPARDIQRASGKFRKCAFS